MNFRPNVKERHKNQYRALEIRGETFLESSTFISPCTKAKKLIIYWLGYEILYIRKSYTRLQQYAKERTSERETAVALENAEISSAFYRPSVG
jgi:hypothetical protein